jgi:hypothetical protein
MILVSIVQKNYKFFHRYNKMNSILIRILTFLKVVSSNIGVVIIVSMTHILQVIGYSIVYFLVSPTFEANFTAVQVFNYWRVFLLVVFITGVFLLLIIDISMNIKSLLICSCKKFWIKNDPYFFKIQQLVFLPMIVVLFQIVSLRLNITISKESRDNIFRECNENNPYFQYDDWLIRIYTYINFFYFSGLILTITFILKIKSWIQKFRRQENNKHSSFEIKKNDIEFIFQDQILTQRFKLFAETDFSLQEIYLFHSIKDYQKCNENEKRQIALKIYHKYLNGKYSELEVNIPRLETLKIFQKLNTPSMLDDLLFQDIEKLTIRNILETFDRFKKSSEFEEYSKASNVVGETINLLNK